MAGNHNLIELKFRLADGSDIGPSNYGLGTTVATLKEKIVSQWPKGKANGPRSVNDIKLINAGKILENNRTLAESGFPISESSTGVTTMHVVVQPPLPNKTSRKLRNDPMKQPSCSCSIL